MLYFCVLVTSDSLFTQSFNNVLSPEHLNINYYRILGNIQYRDRHVYTSGLLGVVKKTAFLWYKLYKPLASMYAWLTLPQQSPGSLTQHHLDDWEPWQTAGTHNFWWRRCAREHHLQAGPATATLTTVQVMNSNWVF